MKYVLVFLLTWFLAVLVEHNFHGWGRFERRLQSPCVKCGSSEISFRYCVNACETPCPLTDIGQKRGAPVVWAHEHLHRDCRSCGYTKDAMECFDHAQP